MNKPCHHFLTGVFGQDGPPPPEGGDFGGAPPPWYCDQISNEDCMDHLMDQRCGTDGVTYYNSCVHIISLIHI